MGLPVLKIVIRSRLEAVRVLAPLAHVHFGEAVDELVDGDLVVLKSRGVHHRAEVVENLNLLLVSQTSL